VDHLCAKLSLVKDVAYKKVRGHDFQSTVIQAASLATRCAGEFAALLPFTDVDPQLIGRFLQQPSKDQILLEQVTSETDPRNRLSVLFEVFTLQTMAKGHHDHAYLDHWCPLPEPQKSDWDSLGEYQLG
jgi:hypothetical protein